MSGANPFFNTLFDASGARNTTHSVYQNQALAMQEGERRRLEELRRAKLHRDMCEFMEYAVQFDPNLKQLFTAWLAARKLES